MRVVMSLAVSAAVLTLVLFVAAAGSPPAALAAAAPASMAAGDDGGRKDGDRFRGRALYLRENCYICHGGRAGGGMCPSLREDPPNESDIEKVVEDGTPNGMPSYRERLTERDIEDLAAYFDSLRTSREPTFTHWWDVIPAEPRPRR